MKTVWWTRAVVLLILIASQLSSAAWSAGASVLHKLSEFHEDDDVSAMAFSPDGSHLLVHTFLTTHLNWWQLGAQPRISQTVALPRGDHLGVTNGIRFSPDGSRVSVTLSGVCADPTEVRIFNAAQLSDYHDISEPTCAGWHSRVEYLPNGQFVRLFDAIKPAGRAQLFVHDATTFEPLWSARMGSLTVVSLALSRDGKFAAVGGYLRDQDQASQVQIIDLQSRSVVSKYSAPQWASGVEQVAWHPDGRSIAIGGTINGNKPTDSVQIIEVPSGTILAHEDVGSAHIQALRYTPDSRYLIECGIPKKVEIWDSSHKTLLQQIPAKDCYSLAVSRDSKLLAVSDRKYISIWQLL